MRGGLLCLHINLGIYEKKIWVAIFFFSFFLLISVFWPEVIFKLGIRMYVLLCSASLKFSYLDLCVCV